jgi:hypothetical protein
MNCGNFFIHLMLLVIILWSSWYLSGYLFSRRFPEALLTAKYDRDKRAVSSVIQARFPWLDSKGLRDNVDSAMMCLSSREDADHKNQNSLKTPLKLIDYCVAQLNQEDGL